MACPESCHTDSRLGRVWAIKAEETECCSQGKAKCPMTLASCAKWARNCVTQLQVGLIHCWMWFMIEVCANTYGKPEGTFTYWLSWSQTCTSVLDMTPQYSLAGTAPPFTITLPQCHIPQCPLTQCPLCSICWHWNGNSCNLWFLIIQISPLKYQIRYTNEENVRYVIFLLHHPHYTQYSLIGGGSRESSRGSANGSSMAGTSMWPVSRGCTLALALF